MSTQKKSRLRISKDSVTGVYLSVVCAVSAHRIRARRRNAAMPVAATQAHSPAGFNRMVAVAGLLTCSAPCAFSEHAAPMAWLHEVALGTYSSGYCSGLSPDSLLNPLGGRLFGPRDTIATAKLQFFPHTRKTNSDAEDRVRETQRQNDKRDKLSCSFYKILCRFCLYDLLFSLSAAQTPKMCRNQVEMPT